MSKHSATSPYQVTGTTSPIKIGGEAGTAVVMPGQTYFYIKIVGAQAAFWGSIWERVQRLVITSQVALNHPLLGAEPMRAIQRSREVRRGRSEQLGLSPNLVNVVPATMTHISISLEFVLDKENRLRQLSGLINDDAFMSAVSLAPGAAMATHAIGGLAQKILQTFVPAEEREPILQFGGDFNIAGGGLHTGHYAILGTRDEEHPIPNPLPVLEVKDSMLLAGSKALDGLSYVILEVGMLTARGSALSDGAHWLDRLRRAEAAARLFASDPFVAGDVAVARKTWEECTTLLKEAQVLLIADSNLLPREADDIIKASYQYCAEKVRDPTAGRRGGAAAVFSESDLVPARDLLRIPRDEDLQAAAARYAGQVAEAERILMQAGFTHA
jgi:hypothetical protein